MEKLPVTPPGSHDHPPVLLKRPDELSDLHSKSIENG